MAKSRTDDVPQADAVQWMGLCPCGCGSYKVVLLDEDDEALATFGWDEDGWIKFVAGVLRNMKEESDDGSVGLDRTPH